MSAMAERVWYRSLYWRIALGFVVLLAALMTAQAVVTFWLAGRVTDLLPGRSPAEFASVLAADLSAEMAADPDVDLEALVHERYSRAAQSFAIVTRDGRAVLSERVQPPPMITRTARGALFGGGPGRPGGAGGRGANATVEAGEADPNAGRGGRAGRGGARGGTGRAGAPSFELAAVMVDGEQTGIVAVPSQLPPLSTLLRGFGPTLAAVGFVLLAIGTAAAALLVFRPAHRRLRGLEQAARALGAGESSVRAPESGGDEVASLARTFNEMAGDLHSRAAALVEADRTRRQLLADISHELATPLAAIRGYAETLGMPHLNLDQPTRQRYLQVITDETERLEHIVGDLLDLARLEGGGSQLKDERVPVEALFARVVERHQPLLDERQVTMTTSIGDDVGCVQGDGPRLEQALQNLAANAVRHTPEGGVVHLGARRTPDQVILVVDDSGPGIPEEHLPRVFDRFYKVDESRTGTQTPSGSGLGLSIVQAIVSRHGGRVTARNRPDGGARFEILLPAARPDDQM